jgi:hypothetical protein
MHSEFEYNSYLEVLLLLLFLLGARTHSFKLLLSLFNMERSRICWRLGRFRTIDCVRRFSIDSEAEGDPNSSRK